MIREDRYIVLKRTDVLAYLNSDERHRAEVEAVNRLIKKIEHLRAEQNKPPLECVVVERNWPEYEKVWEMIERRVDEESKS